MEFKEKKAIYLQIADYICEAVLRKEWLPDQKIPSIREMAAMLEVNPNTVTRTYSYLEGINVIRIQRGVGYFVSQDAGEIILNKKKKAFFQEELPHFFASIKAMNIDIAEIVSLYDKVDERHEQ